MVLCKRRLPCFGWSSIPIANVLCGMKQRSIVTYLETILKHPSKPAELGTVYLCASL